MPDLIDKYFQEDLTEAEQEALGRSLLDSDEAALKFEAMAKEAYIRYGHPEPQPNWKDIPPPSMPPKPGFGPLFWLTMLAVGAGLFWGWRSHFWNVSADDAAHSPITMKHGKENAHSHAFIAGSVKRRDEAGSSQVVESRKKEAATAPEQERVLPEEKASLPPKEAQPETQERPKAVEAKPAAPAAAPAAAAAAQGRGVTPVNLDLGPPKTFSNLSVEVGQAQMGRLTVRVIDGQEREMVVLYNGNLPAGNWAFEWDGRLVNGQAAQPGIYKIEVRSGSFVQRKDIQIQ